jgi:hypothetical protein
MDRIESVLERIGQVVAERALTPGSPPASGRGER